jgi:centrosomal protein CEP76
MVPEENLLLEEKLLNVLLKPKTVFHFFRYIHRFIDPDDPPLNKQLPKPEHPYQTVGCIFNHRAFYANCQPSDRVDVCQFDLPNKSLWKAMSEDAIRSVCGNLGLVGFL